MTSPDLLEHDATAYADLYERVRELSRNWRPDRVDLSQRRQPLLEIWRQIRADERKALPRAMVAHLLADLEDEPQAELEWDLVSLRALAPVWEQVADARLFDAGSRCLPSIYLSLAGASERCGDTQAAVEYLRRAQLLLAVLPSGEYARRLTSEIRHLGRSLGGRMA